MREEVIKANKIDAAVDGILYVLKNTGILFYNPILQWNSTLAMQETTKPHAVEERRVLPYDRSNFWRELGDGTCYCHTVQNFRFMTYKVPECFAAAATTMATTKEAKLMSEFLRNKRSYSRSHFIRNCTLGAMFRIFKECSAVEESTRV